MIKKRLTAVFFVVALVVAAPVTASAHEHEPLHPTDPPVVHPPISPHPPEYHPPEEPPVHQAKCNSGRGNGSETTPANDCDPGNSGGVNQGGD